MRYVTPLILLAAIACPGHAPAADPVAAPVRITGWVSTNSDFQHAFPSFYNHAARLTEISPFWFHPVADGSVTAYEADRNTGKRLDQIEGLFMSVCRANGIKVLPCLGEAGGEFEGAARKIMHDPKLRAVHIRNLVALAKSRGYDGLDIDYEGLKVEDRDAYGAFMTELSAAMHAEKLLLTAAVFAKTDEPGDWDGPQAQDWALLAKVLDRVRIMIYDFHEDSSKPGSIAPMDWFKDVIALALKRFKPEQIQAGIPTYGYDWQLDDGAEDLPQREGPIIAARFGATLFYEPDQACSHFTYETLGSPHDAWYEDARALPAKIKILQDAGIWGIAVWQFSEEGEEFWQAVGPVRPSEPSAPPKP